MGKYAKIELTKKLLSELKDYEKNNKIHPEIQKETLKEIIEEVWYDVPIIIDKHDVIVAWHCRRQVLQMLDYEYVDVIVKDKLSEKQIRKYRLLDNKIAELAEDNIENIRLELEELEDPELNELYDFEIETLDPDKEAIEDTVPEVSDNIIVEKWDIFQLWEHRLMCWDSTSIDDVEKLMDWEKAEMVFTDPPYWVEYDWWHATDKRRDKLQNDDKLDMYAQPVINAFMFSDEKAPLYLWFADRFSMDVMNGLNNAWYTVRNWIIWNKNLAQFWAIWAQYKSKHEPCIYAFKNKKAPRWAWPNNEVTVWDIKREAKNNLHLTQKPIELIDRAILNHKPKSILDLFWGSGSSMIWAEKNNIKAFTMELDEKYIQVILKRYKDYTDWKKEIKCLNREIDLSLILD